MTRLRFRDQDRFMVGLALMGEAGVTVEARGANELEADGLGRLNDEQRAELARLVVDPVTYDTQAEAVPPGAVEGTQPGTAVSWVGDMPPRTGPGATRDAWAAFADNNQVAYAPDASRDEIIRAVEAHGDR